MVDQIDLTFSDSDNEAPPPQSTAAVASRDTAAEDAAAKKRIMEFATAKSSSKRSRSDHSDMHADPLGSAAACRTSSKPPTAGQESSEDAAQKQRIMDFARAKAAADTAGNSNTATIASPAARDSADAGTGGFGNSDLRALHEARMHRQQQQQQQQAPANDGVTGTDTTAAAAAAADKQPNPQQQTHHAGVGEPVAAGTAATAATSNGNTISLLTYNVWFKEEVACLERMMAIGDIIVQAGYPTFICLQEVTPFILELFVNMDWWSRYHCCPAPDDAPYFTLLLVNKSAAAGVSDSSFRERPFYNSVMGRSLRSITSSICQHPILVATSHLESPVPPTNFFSKQRQEQMEEALKFLDAAGVGNVLFAGDMNWTDSRDGSPPLPAGWVDAWQQLQPGQPGFTYNSKMNPMLTFKGPGLRLDRIFCKLRDWKLQSIKLVGTQQLAGVQYQHTFRNGGSKQLPVLPSDHFGLLLQLEEF